MSPDQLVDELRTLGRSYDPRPIDADTMVGHVMDRLPGPTPGGRLHRRKPTRRAILSAVAALLVVLLATPPVRAAVADWFGVIVRDGPPAKTAVVPPADGEPEITAAAQLVDFDPVIPAVLGSPEAVDVSADGRVLSMSWPDDDGTIRLDQFEGALFPAFVKATDEAAEQIDLDGVQALWFPGPHYLITIGADGAERTETTRTAGPTLIWPVDGLTLRLEGLGYDRAVQIATETSTGTSRR